MGVGVRFHGLGLLFFISINMAYRKRSVFLELLYDTLHELRGVSRQPLQQEQSCPGSFPPTLRNPKSAKTNPWSSPSMVLTSAPRGKVWRRKPDLLENLKQGLRAAHNLWVRDAWRELLWEQLWGGLAVLVEERLDMTLNAHWQPQKPATSWVPRKKLHQQVEEGDSVESPTQNTLSLGSPP